MAWWDHEELKAREDRSDHYVLAFPEEYSAKEITAAILRVKRRQLEKDILEIEKQSRANKEKLTRLKQELNEL